MTINRYGYRIKETTTTTGTGSYTLAGAVTGFVSFSYGLSSSSSDIDTHYCCTDGTNWEIGIGTLTAEDSTILERKIVIASSYFDGAVDWESGSKEIFCIMPPALPNLVTVDGYGGTAYVSNNTLTDGNKGVIIGSNNDHGGLSGTIIGDDNYIHTNIYYSTVLGRYGKCHINNSLVLSQVMRSATGDSQVSYRTGTMSTTDATTASITASFYPSSNISSCTLLYEAEIVARQTAGSAGTVGDSKGWLLRAIATKASSTLTQLGTTTSSVIGESTGASAWTCVFDFSYTSAIRCTGEANKTIAWVGFLKIVELAVST